MPLSYKPPLGLKNYFELLREQKFKQERSFPYAGMCVFSGPQGSGKTQLAMHLVDDIMQAYPKCILVSNIKIFGVSAIPYKDLSDFISYTNGEYGIIFLLDEIQNYFCSLQSKELPPEVLEIVSQNRKNFRLIVGTSQRWNRVAKPFREQTDYLYECRRAFFNFFPFRELDATLFDDDGNYTGEVIPPFQLYVPNPKILRMYDTLERVSPKLDEFKNKEDNEKAKRKGYKVI